MGSASTIAIVLVELTTKFGSSVRDYHIDDHCVCKNKTVVDFNLAITY